MMNRSTVNILGYQRLDQAYLDEDSKKFAQAARTQAVVKSRKLSGSRQYRGKSTKALGDSLGTTGGLVTHRQHIWLLNLIEKLSASVLSNESSSE